MFEHFSSFPWVLPIYRYDSQDQLLSTLDDRVIGPAESWLRYRAVASSLAQLLDQPRRELEEMKAQIRRLHEEIEALKAVRESSHQ